MRAKRAWQILLVGAVLSAWSFQAVAELQTVSVSGEIRIRGTSWWNSFNPRTAPAHVGPELRIPSQLLRPRPIGDWLGGQNVFSYFSWDSDRDDYQLVEERTTLGFRADFSDDVSAYIELESYDVWGEDFRSQNYLTGLDTRGATSDDVEMYQAYIEVNNMFGPPLRLRIGRQEMVFGSGWLVGNSSNHAEFRGFSFDAVRLTYAPGDFTIDAFWSKLIDRYALGLEDDADFMGIYGSYTGLEDIVLDAYWLWIHDSLDVEDVVGGPLLEWIEDLRGVDDYGDTDLHTVGLRAAGNVGGFDFEAEAAYQFGEASQLGTLFRAGMYGDDDADFDAWAAHLELGYTLDTGWQPRFSLYCAYFDGEDNRDISFLDWLNPFYKPEASASFNRLFSNRVYSYFFDEMGQLSNAWTVGAGVELHPLEVLDIKLRAAYFEAVEPFDLPKYVGIGNIAIAVSGPFTFWTDEAEAELGWDILLAVVYHYSEDLDFEIGWSHLFTGDGLAQGNYVDLNGLLSTRGTDNEDADYLYGQMRIRF